MYAKIAHEDARVNSKHTSLGHNDAYGTNLDLSMFYCE